MTKIQIAIDGPAGAGKSTVARQIAQLLNYIYIDTGAMYRALTHLALTKDINVHDSQQLTMLLKTNPMRLVQAEEEQQVFVNGKNITKELRSLSVTKHVPTVASHPDVREELVKKQRLLAKNGGVVMDGRDIGTCVLVDAQLKIFLQASVIERTKRRHEELKQKGTEISFEKLKEEIELRDKLDSEREAAPLKKAVDAIEIDTTRLTIEQVVNKILTLVTERV